MAEYPGDIYSPRLKENKSGVVYNAAKKTVGYVEDVTKLDDEIVAIETELGTDPKGADADVKTRLNRIDGELDEMTLQTVRDYIALRADTTYITDSTLAYSSKAAFVRFNKAKYPNLQSIKFAAKLYTAVAGGVAYAKLKNQSTGVEVVQSEVSHNGTDSWDVSCFKISVDVKDNIADNENTYCFRMKTNDVTKAARLVTAYIIVEYQVYA